MTDERTQIPAGELGRWLFVAVLILVGVVFYFRYAPSARSLATPTTQDAAP
jgi:hypothetical protein